VSFNTPPIATAGITGNLDPMLPGIRPLPALSGTATTAGATLVRYTVLSLPTSGTLYCNAAPITAVPAACAPNALGYTASRSVTATLSFSFTVTDSNGQVSTPAVVAIALSASPVLTLVKTADANMTVGFNAGYTLQVSNHAPLQDSSGVITVTDTLPPGLDFVSAAGASAGSSWICNWTAATRTVLCSSSTPVPAQSNAEAIRLITMPNAQAVASGASATVSNTATVAGGGELPAYADGTAPGALPHSSTATQTVSRAALISGTSWVDLNHNGVRDPGEPIAAPNSIRVEVWPAGTSAAQTVGATPLSSVVVDASGNYSLPAPVGNVQLRFVDISTNATLGQPVNGETPASHNQPTATGSNGVVSHGVIDNVSVAAGAVLTQQSLPIDPEGVVYDSGTRQPIGGASVSLLSGGVLVPVNCLSGGVNPFVTPASGGAAGVYQFLLDFSAPGCGALSGHTFNLAVSAAGYTSPSQVLPAGLGGVNTLTTPAGAGTFAVVSKSTAPAAADPTTHYLAVVLSTGAQGVVNNHIPLDGAAVGALALSKTASKSTAEIGDTVRYTLQVRNTGKGASGPITLMDRLPLGFKYMRNTAVVVVNGTSQVLEPQVTGSNLTIPINGLAPGASTMVQYLVRLGIGADRGDGINRVTAQAGSLHSNEATARVKVSGGVFGTDACLVGVVFADCNGNGVQDAGESGVAGVRLLMETGLSIVTDANGKFSYCGLTPQTHAIKLDPKTLPVGAHSVITSNRNLGDPNSLLLDTNNGELIRADFALDQCASPASPVAPGDGPAEKPEGSIYFESEVPAISGVRK